MAEYLIDHIPISNTQISERIIARKMQLTFEHFPVRTKARLHEQVVHTIDKQGIK